MLVPGLVAAVSGCGGDAQPEPRDPFLAARQGQSPSAARTAAPRWERLARLSGTGESRERLVISRRALQWRVRWRCSSGQITFSAAPGARTARPRGEGECPGTGGSIWTQLGSVRLRVAATGRWSATVEQQFDSALREPPLPAMRSRGARVLGRGRFYRMEGRGNGKALVYQLSTGSLALRLEGLQIPPTSGMFVWLSEARRPMTSVEAIRTRSVRLGALKSTLGDQNYRLPRGLGRDAVRSVVVWYKPTRTAYIAAALR